MTKKVSCCCCNCSKSTKYKLEILGLVLGCILIALLFSSILLYYYINTYAIADNGEGSNSSLPSFTFTFNPPSQSTTTTTVNTTTCTNDTLNITNTVVTIPQVTLCSLHGIGYTDSDCTCSDVYSGSICTDVLKTWQSCAIINNKPSQLYIRPGLDQMSLESDIRYFLDYIELATTECQQVGFPLLCLNTYPLCDCNTNKLFQPTREMCQQMRDTICYAEWQLVSFYNPSALPDCDQLPEPSEIPTPPSHTVEVITNCISNQSNITTALNNSSYTNTTDEQMSDNNVTCRYDFIEDNGYCWASCYKWKQDPDSVALVSKIIEITTAVIGLSSTIVCIAFSIYEYKRMFTYPLIFITFMLMDYFVAATFVLISLFGSGLYCSHERLDISQVNPSTFCTISGFAFHYLALQTGMFGLCHMGFFFYSVYFPFHSKKTKDLKKRKAIEITVTLIAFILPALIIGLCFSTNKFRYQQTTWPTVFCTSNYFTYWLYSFVYPNIIVYVVACCAFLLITWKVHKYQGLFKEKKSYKKSLTDPDKKILIVFLTIILFGILTSTLSVVIVVQSGDFADKVTRYWARPRGREP